MLLGTVATHEFFRSDAGRCRSGSEDRPHINLASSALDLQTLYGCDDAAAAAVRSFSGGKLKPARAFLIWAWRPDIA